MADGETHAASGVDLRNKKMAEKLLPSKDTPLAKVIIGFNLFMTGLLTFLRRYSESDEALSDDSIVVLRPLFYIGPLILFCIVAVIITIKVSYSNRRNVPELIKSLFIGTCLTIAGVLYLSGDNIRILYEEFDTNVTIGDEVIQVKDLRSHLVAISLGFMIISQIGPIVSRLVSDYRQRPSTLTLVVSFDKAPDRTNNAFWKAYRKLVLCLPPGYHPVWKEGKTLIYEQQDIVKFDERGKTLLLQTVNFKEETYVNEHGQKVTQKTPFGITELKIHFFQNTNDFIEVTEVEVRDYYNTSPRNRQEGILLGEYGTIASIDSSTNTCDQHAESNSQDFDEEIEIKGKSPSFKISNEFRTWSARFEISQDNVYDQDTQDDSNNTEQTPFQIKQMQKSKTASLSLLGACFALLDYALVADALYTTLLDEITQHNETVSEGFDCPAAHVGVAKSMYGLITGIWILVIVVVLPMGFCCCNKRYHLLGEWEEIRKKIDIKPQIQLGVSKILDYLVEKRLFHKRALIINIIYGITSSYCLLFTVIFAIILFLVLAIPQFSLITMIVSLGIFLILSYSTIIKAKRLYKDLSLVSVLTPVKMLYGCIRTCTSSCCRQCTCKCRCHQLRQKFKDIFKGLIRVLISFNLWIAVIGVFAVSAYLPLYLAADNSWPWVCNDKEWNVKRSGLLTISSLIFIAPVLYLLLRYLKEFLDKRLTQRATSSTTDIRRSRN